MLGRANLLMRDSKFWRSCNFIRKHTQKQLNHAIINMGKDMPHGEIRRYILAHELLRDKQDEEAVCEQLLNVVFAGRDTPVVALTAVFFCVVRHPDTWRKIREEVQGFRDEDLTFHRLKSLRYVQSVIKEGSKISKVLMLVLCC